MNTLPKYFFVKRQVNKLKGWELNFNSGEGWPQNLGFFKTLKEAREAIEVHKKMHRTVARV